MHSDPAAPKRPREGEGEPFVPEVPGVIFPRGRETHYTTWLVIGYAIGDAGARPIAGVFWESPDVWVESSLGKDQPVVGQQNRVFARVHNFGLQDATGVQVKFWWANPSLAIAESTAHSLGVGSPAQPIAPNSSAVVEAPVKWIPVFENNGHECLLAEAYIPVFDDLTAPMDPVHDRHVGQKNEQVIVLQPNQKFTVPLQAVNVTGLAQPLHIEVYPVIARVVQRAVATRRRALVGPLGPPLRAVPLALAWRESPPTFVGPGTVYARRLLSAMVADMSGAAADRWTAPQISHARGFEPWEARELEVSGRVPADAEPGQTFAFRVVQRAGRMVTGGYTVHVLVAGAG